MFERQTLYWLTRLRLYLYCLPCMKIHRKLIRMGQDCQFNGDATDAACVCCEFYKLLHSVLASDELLNKFICNSNLTSCIVFHVSPVTLTMGLHQRSDHGLKL